MHGSVSQHAYHTARRSRQRTLARHCRARLLGCSCPHRQLVVSRCTLLHLHWMMRKQAVGVPGFGGDKTAPLQDKRQGSLWQTFLQWLLGTRTDSLVTFLGFLMSQSCGWGLIVCLPVFLSQGRYIHIVASKDISFWFLPTWFGLKGSEYEYSQVEKLTAIAVLWKPHSVCPSTSFTRSGSLYLLAPPQRQSDLKINILNGFRTSRQPGECN